MKDCMSSRRSTVMCALLRATAVITGYQRDSSSKRPRLSVVSAVRTPTHGRRPLWRARPPGLRALAGGAYGAPGPRARHRVGGHYASTLTPARMRHAAIVRSWT